MTGTSTEEGFKTTENGFMRKRKDLRQKGRLIFYTIYIDHHNEVLMSINYNKVTHQNIREHQLNPDLGRGDSKLT